MFSQNREHIVVVMQDAGGKKLAGIMAEQDLPSPPGQNSLTGLRPAFRLP
jgi:hypothetical protein